MKTLANTRWTAAAVAILSLFTLSLLSDALGASRIFSFTVSGQEVPGTEGDSVAPAAGSNGRIYFGSGPNATSSIISFQPGSSPISSGTNLGRGYHPAVSPDGMKVAFVDNTDGPTNNQIMLMNHDGTNRRPLPNPATGFTPTWSPDGTRLAYVVGNFATGQAGSGDIYVMDMAPGNEGANQTKVPNTGNTSQPNWGSNNVLVYYGRTNGAGPVKLGPVPPTAEITSNSPLPVKLITGGSNDNHPVWSPDATKIAFRSYRDSPNFSNSEIYVIDANGGTATRLTNDAQHNLNPTWAPDGTRIAFETPFSLSSVAPNGSDGANPPMIKNGAVYFPNWGVLPGSVTPTPTPAGAVNLAVSLTVIPQPVTEYQPVTVRIAVQNTGGTRATGVKATYLLRGDESFIGGTGCNRSGESVICSLPDINAGSFAPVLDLTLRFEKTGPFPRSVSVTANEPDSNVANNTASTTVNVLAAPRPSNDDYLGGKALVGRQGCMADSNVGATPQSNFFGRTEFLHAGKVAGKSVWYFWKADNTGFASFNTFNSDFGTVLAVYETSPEGNTLVRVASHYGQYGAEVYFPARKDVIYSVVVTGINNRAAGNISLCWKLGPEKVPAPVSQFIERVEPAVVSQRPAIVDGVIGNDQIITITGRNFTAQSQVYLDGEFLTTTFRGDNTKLEGLIPKRKLVRAGQRIVTVRTGNSETNGWALAVEKFSWFPWSGGVVSGCTATSAGTTFEGKTCATVSNAGSNTFNVTTAVYDAQKLPGQPGTSLGNSGFGIHLAPPNAAPTAIPGSTTVGALLQVPPVSQVGSSPKVVVGLIGLDGSTLVGHDGSSLVGHDGSSLVGHDGSSLVGHDGSSVLPLSSGQLIGQDGGSLIGQDGGSRPAIIEHGIPEGNEVGDVARSYKITWVTVRSSDGSAPIIDTATDADGNVSLSASFTLSNTSTPSVTNLNNALFAVVDDPALARLSAQSYTVAEDAGAATISVTRTGETAQPATVGYDVSDGGGHGSCDPAGTGEAGLANERCDFTVTRGTVRFAAGETTKEVRIPIIDDKYSEGNETFRFIIGDTYGLAIEAPGAATITILDDDAGGGTVNPLDNPDGKFFVRQQYLDLLGRVPSPGELTAGSDPITQCGADLACRKTKMVDRSYAIFLQSQHAAGYVFRLYRSAFGNNQPFPISGVANLSEAKKWPSYAVLSRDRATLADAANLAEKQLELANSFVLRPAFARKYPVATLVDGPAFVDAVLANIMSDIGVDLTSQRATLIDEFNDTGGSMAGRAAVMYRLADASFNNPVNNVPFVNAEDPRVFAAMLHIGYLKLDGSTSSLTSLLSQLASAADRKIFVEQFVTGAEYRLRFGPTASDVSVTGRVLTPSGQALRNATVSLLTPQGQRRTATTSSFGVFTFAGVPVGSAYTVTVASKRYRFAPLNVTPSGNLNVGDLVGLE